MNVLINLDLLSVGVAIAGTLVLGFAVYFSDRTSLTNKFFLLFVLVTAFWGLVNYISYKFDSQLLTLWLLRFVLFTAVWQAFSLFSFLYTFPAQNKKLPVWYKRFLLPINILIAFLTLTPLVFSNAFKLSESSLVAIPITNYGIILFGINNILLVVLGILFLIRKLYLDKPNKSLYKVVLSGIFLMFALVIPLNFILPVMFSNVNFIPLGALFVFPFIAFTSYAILRHHLFSVRAMWAGVLVFLLAITAFFEVIFAGELGLILYRGAVFFILLFFGILLIKGIIRETKQREEIQELADRLKSVNSILAHDVKGAFAKGRGAFSLLLEGTYGPIPEKSRPLLANISNDWKRMLDAITSILAAGRDMVLMVEPFNLKDAVLEVVSDIAKDAEAKHLEVKTEIPEGDYTIIADKTQLTTHVLKNLIENAINYNLENGSVSIKLSKKDASTFLFIVADTGVGIKEEDRPNMFKEGGRGKESIKTNVYSSGYGLATAKKTTEAHGGRVWFESEGVAGKGTTFFVELPVVARTQNKTE